ncbi:hypothetical protein [Alteromonas flava]|uniref:hypothetical protein n=1 Tax=Alteromonas flava TaxID=2048003 RepID=UPI000C284325|nr:hypothetical protein [Alteromonas flava]
MQPEKPQDIYQSSRVQKALAGELSIDSLAIFRQANELTKSNFSTFALAGLIVVSILFGVVFLLLAVMEVPLENFMAMTQTQSAIVDIVLILVISPLMAGLMMMGINAARQRRVETSDLFSWLSITIVLALGSLIASIMVQIGMVLFVLPGIYLGIVTTFTLPLIADKKLTAISAIMLSVRVCSKYLIQMALFFIISVALFVFAMFTFGIALIWVFPLYFNAKGILYDELFGSDDMPSVDAQVTTFNA